MKKIKIAIICEEVFHISLITYLILLLVETLKEGFVSYFFNLNILLAIVLASGIGRVVFTNTLLERMEQKSKEKKLSMKLIFSMSLGGGIVVYYKTQELGALALVLSILSMLLIFLLSFIIATDKTNS